jgi:hypothetical protein
VAALRRVFRRGAEAPLYLEARTKTKTKTKADPYGMTNKKSNSKSNGNSNDKSGIQGFFPFDFAQGQNGDFLFGGFYRC